MQFGGHSHHGRLASDGYENSQSLETDGRLISIYSGTFRPRLPAGSEVLILPALCFEIHLNLSNSLDGVLKRRHLLLN